MKKIYISGKIGNLPIEEAKAKFQKQADIIRAAGHQPMNPFDNGVVCPPDMPIAEQWNMHMRADIIMLMECDECHMLPCWVTSKGAGIEREIAASIGIPVIYL